MKKKIYTALLATGLILGITGCSTMQSGLDSVKGTLNTAVTKVSQLTKNTIKSISGDKHSEDSDSTAADIAVDAPQVIRTKTVAAVDTTSTVAATDITETETVINKEPEAAPEVIKAPEPLSPGKPVNIPTPTPVKPSKLAESIAGQWNISQAGVITIDVDDMPYIFFEPLSGRFYANNGCNTLNGTFAVDDNGVITFSNVLSTMRYCPDIPYELAINAVIADNKTSRIEITDLGAETAIDFLDAEGKTTLRLSRGELDFLNGHWSVETIAGLENLEAAADIFFDLPELKLHGNTGCNYFNGDIYLDHRVSGGIDFSNMGLTRMACPYTTQETAMMVALEQTAAAINGDNGRAMLVDSQGRELMTLTRISSENEE
ncbi:MAG: META domain-containing protein [Muribaculaceae bacterium]|nr:META domain-containing protein [Muribaculaceae bacterium]